MEITPQRVWPASQTNQKAQPSSGRLNLARLPWLRPVLQSRWPQLAARAAAMAGFVFIIAAGLFGSPVGSHNIAIIFVWIAWWTALKLAFIPLGGRSWCSVCPLPMGGEWLQRGGLLEQRTGRFGLNLRWPKRLRGSWLQWAGFLIIGLFSAVTLTDPRVTAWALLGLFGLATVMGVVFERRAFCSHVCPIGGFTSIYAKTAPVEVRVINTAVCAAHSEKTCYTNCPWGLYPLALRDSAQCGLCMECLRVCPENNIAVNLRPFGSDLAQTAPTPKLDETFLALMMLGAAVAFAAVFTGPWGALKEAAFNIGSAAWLGYGAGFLALNLAALPGLYGLAAWMARRPGETRKKAFTRLSNSLLPLGLCAWIAFTVSFALPKAGYVAGVISDPLGWGWNLFGAAGADWNLGSGLAPVLQAAVIAAGLFWAGRVVVQAQGVQAWKKALPLLAFCFAYSAVMLWLLVG